MHSYTSCFIAGVSKDNPNELCIFSSSLMRSWQFSVSPAGEHFVTYQTDLGQWLNAPERFPTMSEAWEYSANVCEYLLTNSSFLSVLYWLRRYPNFESYEVVRHYRAGNDLNLDFTRTKLQLNRYSNI